MSQSPLIKAVMFDAGGVLHKSHTSLRQELQDEFKLTDEQTDQLFEQYIPLMGSGKITEEELWKELQKRWGIRNVRTDEHLFTRTFVTTLTKMPGMYELVEELKDKGLEVVLLTNVSPQYAEVLRGHGHYDPFKIKVLSYEVGAWKPDPAIYQHALKALGMKPEETIFIDDAPRNITAAEALGIHGIVFHTAEQVKSELTTLLSV